MLAPEEWIKMVVDNVRDFADVEYQQRVWVRGEGPEVSCFDEAYLTFSDLETDLLLNEKWSEWGKPENPRRQLSEFLGELRAFYSSQPSAVDVAEMLRSPGWSRVVALAQRAVDSCKSELGISGI